MSASRGGPAPARLLAALASLLLATVAAAAPSGHVAAGDEAWDARAGNAADERPPRDPIFESIRHYEAALDADPANLEARWKLLRSLHFAGEFVVEDDGERHALFERGRDEAEDALARLAERLGEAERLENPAYAIDAERLAAAGLEPRDVARLYFWAAIDWGAWSRTAGTLASLRTGVVDRLRRYAAVTRKLEPGYEEGGVLRLLGSLHTGLPRVPFLTGWVDPDEGVRMLERAYEMAPEHPGNALLLAVTLLDRAPERRDEAVALLEQVDATSPRDDMRAEDRAIQREARERLDALRSEGRA